MLISEVIEQIKNIYIGKDMEGKPIDEIKTRDKVLFGETDQECTGLVTTCYASIEVIKETIAKHANLIICHESAFWNRGADIRQLEDNSVYQEKIKLLNENGIAIWRNHDYIHSGMMIDGKPVDALFYGVMKKLEWDSYWAKDQGDALNYHFPNVSAQEIASHLISKLGLKGIRIIGNPTTCINKLRIPFHIMGGASDIQLIQQMEEKQLDALIAMELVDFTVSSYVRDSSQIGKPKVIFSVGHFNFEEPGMEYLLDYLPTTVQEAIPAYFVKSGDTFDYTLC